VDEGCEWKGNKEQKHSRSDVQSNCVSCLTSTSSFKTCQPIRHQGLASSYRGRVEKGKMIWIWDILNCFFCPGGYILFPRLKKVSVCVCVAVPVDVQQLYDRPSCKFLPTQSDLSHKSTRIKSKIEAKRLKHFSLFH